MTARFFNVVAKRQVTALIVVWIFVQAGLFYTYGINPTLESLKYIGAAESLLNNGELPGIRYFFYLTTTLIIALCLKTGAGYTGVVVIQLLLNLTATLAFFTALKRQQQKEWTAFVTVILLLTFLPYQTWNFYLYTESIFYSYSLLFFSACLYYAETSKKAILVQGILLSLAIVSRPLGILLLPCWILFIAVKKKIRLPVLLPLFSIGIALTVLVCNTIMNGISDWHILQSAEYGSIICDIPARTKLELDHLKNYSPVAQLGLFILQYPLEFLNLCLKRLGAFLLLSRDYYGTAHNIYLLAYAAVCTIPMIANVIRRRKTMTGNPAYLLSLFIIISFCLAVALQCDDYHNRFQNTIIPVFLFIGVFMFLDNSNFFKTTKR